MLPMTVYICQRPLPRGHCFISLLSPYYPLAQKPDLLKCLEESYGGTCLGLPHLEKWYFCLCSDGDSNLPVFTRAAFLTAIISNLHAPRTLRVPWSTLLETETGSLVFNPKGACGAGDYFIPSLSTTHKHTEVTQLHK